MALRNIVREGDPILGKKCRPVTEITDRTRELIDDMIETLRDSGGIGLAAPQVGILRRIVVIELDGVLYELINPEFVETEGDQFELEACLSVPDLMGRVHRPARVKVRAMDRNGEMHEYEGTELLARAFCHELDHLDGILYTSKAVEVFDHDPEEDENEEE